MDYNSNRTKLVLPEYGRHIQKMVDHAVAIEDREERMKCAKTVIGIMGNMFPHLRDVSDFKHKLWDHLAIMADFKLDIDFPYELPEPENLYRRPEKVPYRDSRIKFKHYGQIIQEMIGKAIDIEDDEERNQLISLIANHMKKSLFLWNQDSATDERIINDIHRLSQGKLKVDENLKIPDFKDTQHRARQKKRIPKRVGDKK